MSNERLKDLIERQNKLWNRMQELDRVAVDDKRDWTAEERGNWDAADVELTQVSEDIERLQRDAKREAIDYGQVIDAGAPEEQAAGAEIERAGEADLVQREKVYNEAFATYMRHGMERLDAEQRGLLLQNQGDIRAQAVGTTTAGGFLVPPGFRKVLSETMKAYGGLINLANVITTSTGNPLQWPTSDDTSNTGAILTENTQITQQDMTLGSRTLGAYVYTSKLVLVSLQLLQDSAFDLDSWLPRKLGERIGRAVSAHLVSGSGTGQPTGLLTGITVGKTGLTGQTATIIYDDLVDLEHSVDPAYREPDARFLMADSTLKVLRKLKDTLGRPLWLPIPTPGFPATINGWPYTIDQGMPAPGANNKSIVFGDFDAGYIVRQVVDVQMVRLAERYADYLQVGFFGFSRLDASPDDPAAVRAFQHSAT